MNKGSAVAGMVALGVIVLGATVASAKPKPNPNLPTPTPPGPVPQPTPEPIPVPPPELCTAEDIAYIEGRVQEHRDEVAAGQQLLAELKSERQDVVEQLAMLNGTLRQYELDMAALTAAAGNDPKMANLIATRAQDIARTKGIIGNLNAEHSRLTRDIEQVDANTAQSAADLQAALDALAACLGEAK
jgi:hypothetical protein